MLARKYYEHDYEHDNPYLFGLVCRVRDSTTATQNRRRPKFETLYDVCLTIRDDEGGALDMLVQLGPVLQRYECRRCRTNQGDGTDSQELGIKTKRKEVMMDGDGYLFGVLLTYYDSCIHSILLFHIVRSSSRTNTATTSLKIRVCI
jgi:hypothetical protein